MSEVQVFANSINVALSKTATQSSDYPSARPAVYGPASYAVDGDTSTFNHVNFTTEEVGAGNDSSQLSVL